MSASRGDDREEFSAVELVTGLLMALRLRGYKSIELGDRTQEAIVRASESFTKQLSEEGYWISYYFAVHPIHGGSQTVREALYSPSVALWLQRWTGDRAVELKFSPSEAIEMLARLPGPAQRWIDLAGRFLAEHEKRF